MKRRSFIQTITTIGFLAPLLKVPKPKPEPLTVIHPDPTHWINDPVYCSGMSATAHAGFLPDYQHQVIKSCKAMSRKIERGIFTNEV